MTKTTTALMMMMMTAALVLAGTNPALAQTTPTGPNRFVNVSFGAQPQRRTVDAHLKTTIFEDQAEFNAEHRVSNGPFFDISAGEMVMETLIVGVGFSYFGSKGAASGTASIPDPLFRGRPSLVSIEGSDLKRTELGFHLQGVWFHPLTKKIDIALAAGPSLFRVKQQFVSGSVADGTQTVTFGVEDQSGVGIGLNAGGDVTYLLTPRYGIGLLLRYTWASVGLDAADVTAGGFQAGLGLRVRF
jgi:hypothetical protein